MRTAHLTGTLIALLLVSATLVVGDCVDGSQQTSNLILIQYDKTMPAEGYEALCHRLSELGFEFVRHYPLSGLLKVLIPSGDDLTTAIYKASGVAGVRHAEEPHSCQACGCPNDEWYWLQWNLKKIGFEAAWERCLKDTTFADPAVIAVLDTGVAYEDYTDDKYQYECAPDLAQVEFVQGYDAVNDDSHPNDDNGHGTFVCGVIAQSTNNAIGVASIGFGCKIMPVKVLGENQAGDTASLVEGIYYALDNGADVLNISLGFSWYYSRSDILEEAVAAAADSGLVLVGSAGNANLPFVKFPAAYNECLAVGATVLGEDGGCEARASYSNYGVALDLVAPGGSFGDVDGNLYPDAVLAQSFDGYLPSGCWDLWWAAGTSPAAGQVSGIAGVLMSLGLGRDETLAALKGTASKVHSDWYEWTPVLDVGGFDCETGYGLVNADEAISCALTGVMPELPEYMVTLYVTTVYSKGGWAGEAVVTVTEKFAWYGHPGYTPAKDVTVYGYWKGSVVGSDSEVTDDWGRCRFRSEKTRAMPPRMEFIVTNVVRGGEEFSPTVDFDPDQVPEGDAMIVRPLRSTGGACASEFFTAWPVAPEQSIY